MVDYNKMSAVDKEVYVRDCLWRIAEVFAPYSFHDIGVNLGIPTYKLDAMNLDNPGDCVGWMLDLLHYGYAKYRDFPKLLTEAFEDSDRKTQYLRFLDEHDITEPFIWKYCTKYAVK